MCYGNRRNRRIPYSRCSCTCTCWPTNPARKIFRRYSFNSWKYSLWLICSWSWKTFEEIIGQIIEATSTDEAATPTDKTITPDEEASIFEEEVVRHNTGADVQAGTIFDITEEELVLGRGYKGKQNKTTFLYSKCIL